MQRTSKYHALKWIVEVRHGLLGGGFGPWEQMAAFNVDRVAYRYADDCKAVNATNQYRVVERTSRGYRTMHEAKR